jgi:hypothetical protein
LPNAILGWGVELNDLNSKYCVTTKEGTSNGKSGFGAEQGIFFTLQSVFFTQIFFTKEKSKK